MIKSSTPIPYPPPPAPHYHIVTFEDGVSKSGPPERSYGSTVHSHDIDSKRYLDAAKDHPEHQHVETMKVSDTGAVSALLRLAREVDVNA